MVSYTVQLKDGMWRQLCTVIVMNGDINES